MGVCDEMVAVVTGGSRGIGRASALRLAHEGADLALVARDVDGVRLGRSLAAMVEEVRGLGRRVVPIAADLTDPSVSRSAVLQQAEAELGPVDVLVNNAAMSQFRNVADWNPDKVRAMYEVNVMAPWELCAAATPGMVERGRGWIVNISSGVAAPDHARPGGAAYGGTKAMLDQMTRCLALELAGTGVVANAVSPQGASETEFVNTLVDQGAMRSDLTEPLEVMAEAVLALATAPTDVSGLVVRDMELLGELDRPARTLDGAAVVVGYTAAEMPARIAELGESSTKQQDLRGAWGQSWGRPSS
jgi:NAD(P)-dependent dehydrogenase (short-subunit alcohol dehydrogenase family)